ncbi:Histone-lysine N-methyltransferase SETDB1 isoform 1 [Schistosoma japonicum]|nr:Histone-lysine N-methyltransferase SETDB1 isoform 1 [Schistosoma japonicum]
MAVQEGFDCGDEYQAELDYIETVEKDKEGYESTVEDLAEISNEATTTPGDVRKCANINKTSHISTTIDQRTLSSRITNGSIITTNDIPIDNDKDGSESENKQNTSSTTSPISESTVNDVDENGDGDDDNNPDTDDKASRSSEISSNSSNRNIFISAKSMSLNKCYDSSESCLNTFDRLTQINIQRSYDSVSAPVKKKKHKTKKKLEEKALFPRISSNLTENISPSETSDKYVIQNISSVYDDIIDSPEHPRTKNNSPLLYASDDLEQKFALITYPNGQNNETSQINPSFIDVSNENLDSSNLSDIIHNEVGKNSDNLSNYTSSHIQSQFKSSKVNIIFNGNDNEQIASIRSRCTIQDVIQEITESNTQTKVNLQKQETVELSNISNQSSQSTLNDTQSNVPVDKTREKIKNFQIPKHYKPIRPKVQVNLYPVVEKEDISIPPHCDDTFNGIDKGSSQMKLKNKSKKFRSKSSSLSSGTSTNEFLCKKSELRKFWMNRAASLPRSFRLLLNATNLLREADFSRVPVVQLCQLENGVKQEDGLEITTQTKRNSDDTKFSSDSQFGLPVDEKKDIKSENCDDLTNSSDSKKAVSEEENVVKNDSQSGTIIDTSKFSSTLSDSPLSNYKGSLKLRLRRVRSTSAFTTVSTSTSQVSKESLQSRTNLSDVDENSSVSRELRRRDKLQRSISLEPEVKDRKPLERSKSHRKDGDRHNRHQHHHRNNRHQQQQSQAHQQSQQLAKRMYPVAQKDWLRARTYFNDINPYIMDAKKMGNLGRYFNHSCNPNVFVQNVFIDTHDPRFPEVAFFAKRNIEVGEEMTWDYGYTVDAVPFKVLYCYCGEPNCRIRLL